MEGIQAPISTQTPWLVRAKSRVRLANLRAASVDSDAWATATAAATAAATTTRSATPTDKNIGITNKPH